MASFGTMFPILAKSKKVNQITEKIFDVIRKIHKAVVTKIDNVRYRQRLTNEQKERLDDIKSRFTSFNSNIAAMETSIQQGLTEGQYELSYDSILAFMKQKVSWEPLIQAFYDLHDFETHTVREGPIPEQMMVVAVFQLAYFEKMTFYTEDEYYKSKEEAKKYIDEHFTELGNVSTGYKPDNRAEVLTDSDGVGTRVYFTAFQFLDESGKPMEYDPGQKFNPKLFQAQPNPKTVIVRGKIIEKVHDGFTDSATAEFVAPIFKVKLDSGSVIERSSLELLKDSIQDVLGNKTSIFVSESSGPSTKRRIGGGRSTRKSARKIKKSSSNKSVINRKRNRKSKRIHK